MDLRKYILSGIERVVSYNKMQMGLQSAEFRDIGDDVTVYANSGVAREQSKDKGKIYRVKDIVDRTPFNPNQIRATLVIEYEPFDGTNIKFTYLDERFNDELVIR